MVGQLEFRLVQKKVSLKATSLEYSKAALKDTRSVVSLGLMRGSLSDGLKERRKDASVEPLRVDRWVRTTGWMRVVSSVCSLEQLWEPKMVAM